MRQYLTADEARQVVDRNEWTEKDEEQIQYVLANVSGRSTQGYRNFGYVVILLPRVEAKLTELGFKIAFGYIKW